VHTQQQQQQQEVQVFVFPFCLRSMPLSENGKIVVLFALVIARCFWSVFKSSLALNRETEPTPSAAIALASHQT
jgi:hypothetical protein